MPPVAPIALVAPWWRHRARGAARYTPFAGLPAAEQTWRGARAVICRTHPSGELWPRSADCGVVILIIYDVRMILSLAFRLIADDKCIQKNPGVSKCRAVPGQSGHAVLHYKCLLLTQSGRMVRSALFDLIGAKSPLGTTRLRAGRSPS